MADEQDRAEALDADKIPADFPPDEPLGVEEPEVTPGGEWERESFDERTDRLAEPDLDVERPLIVPYSETDESLLDDEAAAVADAEIDELDPESDAVVAPAEEAAMHLVDEP